MRARAGRPVPRFTDGFDEACLLVHARRRVALELVGASNGWYRWSADFEKGERPATGTPPSWVETTQNWDADWPDFEAPSLTLEGEMRRDAQHLADLLPGNWRLSVCQGTVAIQNGGVWLQLTERGFRCAQCHDTEAASTRRATRSPTAPSPSSAARRGRARSARWRRGPGRAATTRRRRSCRARPSTCPRATTIASNRYSLRRYTRAPEAQHVPDDLVGTGEPGVEQGVGRLRAFARDEGAQAEDGLARHALVGSPRIALIVAERPPAPGGSDAGEDGSALDPLFGGGEVDNQLLKFQKSRREQEDPASSGGKSRQLMTRRILTAEPCIPDALISSRSVRFAPTCRKFEMAHASGDSS